MKKVYIVAMSDYKNDWYDHYVYANRKDALERIDQLFLERDTMGVEEFDVVELTYCE